LNKEKIKKNICTIKDCGRPTHKKSKYCIFHASEKEKTEEDFKKALKEYVKKIVEENKNYNFRDFIFIGYTEFKNTVFKSTRFWGAIFQGDVDFLGVAFSKETIFFEATFKGNARFIGADFQGYADFRKATFEGDAYFEEATFKGDTDFRKAKFLLLNNFMGATFEGDVDFGNVIFSPGNKLNLKVKGRGIISFKHAFLENIFLDLDLNNGVLIDFTDSLLGNTKSQKEQIENHILQEKNKDFSQAKEIYLLLKNNFHSIGRYNDESWAFKKEKDMERLSYSFNSFIRNIESDEENDEGKISKEEKSKFILFFNWLRTNNFRKWLSSCFFNIIYGYGERPQNVIFTAIFIIIFFAIFFSILGINSLEIIEMEGPTVQEIFNSDSEIVFKGNLLSKTTNFFLDCLYFSVITFTTLGYGDFRPLEGYGRVSAGTEAFIGALMMALFVYTFARRTGGR